MSICSVSLFVCVVSICTTCCQTDEDVFLICWCFFYLHVFSEVSARLALSATIGQRGLFLLSTISEQECEIAGNERSRRFVCLCAGCTQKHCSLNKLLFSKGPICLARP